VDNATEIHIQEALLWLMEGADELRHRPRAEHDPRGGP